MRRRDWVRDGLGEAAATLLALVAVAFWLGAMILALVGCSVAEQEPAWPESDEFKHIETGADRFSVHNTNLGKWRVLVDHETGVQYIVGNTVHTVCPLLAADGTPLLVAESGE